MPPAAPVARRMGDSVYNPLTGLGTSVDPSTFNRHYHRPLTAAEIDQSYRGSWIMRKLIDKPAKEQVRTRRAWQSDKATIAKLEAEEKRLKVWEKVKQAEIHRGLGGGAIFLWIDGDSPDQPLDPSRIRLGAIRNLIVRHHSRIVLGEMIFDMADDWYGSPSYFQLNDYKLLRGTTETELRFHPSRVIVFKAEEVPDLYTATTEQKFWGASKVEVALAAVINCDTAQSSFAGMIKDAVNVIIGIPGLTERFQTTSDIQAFQTARMTAVNAARSIWRAIVKDNGKGGPNAEGAETIEYRQMNWAGIPETLMVFIYPVAAAGNMPATVLLGKSPDGMNATGDGDMTVWRDEIDNRREVDLRPCLEQLDLALIPSALGKEDAVVWWRFPPLKTPSAKEQAETGKLKAETVQIYINTNLVPDVAMAEGVQNMLEEDGTIPGLADALAKLPPEERFMLLEEPADPNADPNAAPDGGVVE